MKILFETLMWQVYYGWEEGKARESGSKSAELPSVPGSDFIFSTQLSRVRDVCFRERNRMPADLRIDELLDLLAERLGKRVETRLNDLSSSIRPRVLPVRQAA